MFQVIEEKPCGELQVMPSRFCSVSACCLANILIFLVQIISVQLLGTLAQGAMSSGIFFQVSAQNMCFVSRLGAATTHGGENKSCAV